MSSVFVAIVNFRTAALLVECLKSLASQRLSLGSGKVVVVDNASGDDSVATIGAAIDRNDWSAWAEVVALPVNGGFAYGNNAAIRRVREIDPGFHSVILLNPDTLVRPGAIACLAEFLSRGDAGIAGASIEDADGRRESSAHDDPSPAGELESAASLGLLSRNLAARGSSTDADDTPRACDWVSGACMAIRRDVLDAVGPLDEGFFLYFEEVDFCVRARRLGFACWHVPAARIVHFEGASTGIKVGKRRKPAYWYDSRRRFFVKRYGVMGLVTADVLWAIGRASLVVRRALGLGGRSGIEGEPGSLSRDLLLGDLRALLSGALRGIARHA